MDQYIFDCPACGRHYEGEDAKECSILQIETGFCGEPCESEDIE